MWVWVHVLLRQPESPGLHTSAVVVIRHLRFQIFFSHIYGRRDLEMIFSCDRNNEIKISIIDLFIKIQSITFLNEESIIEYNNFDTSIFGHEFTNLNPDQQQRIINITNINWSSSLERRCYINQYMKRYVSFINKWLVNNSISNNNSIINFVDIGCGPGTASIAFLNYIYFHQEKFPNLRKVEIMLIDHKNNACEAAKQIILDFRNFWFLEESQSHIRGIQITIKLQCVSDNLDNIIITPKVDYFMCCNVICELNTTALDNLFRLLNATSAEFFVSDCVLWRKFDAFSVRCVNYLPNEENIPLDNNRNITLKWFDRILPPIRRAPSTPPAPSDHGPSLVDTLATNLINEIKEEIVDEIVETISNSEGSETPRTGPLWESRDRSESYLDDSPF